MGKLLGTLDAQRRAELEKVVEAGRLRDRAQVISQDVEGSPGFSTVSICLDQHPMGHLVQQYEKGQVWFDEKVADSIEEARELARVLGGGDDTDLGNGLAL